MTAKTRCTAKHGKTRCERMPDHEGRHEAYRYHKRITWTEADRG